MCVYKTCIHTHIHIYIYTHTHTHTTPTIFTSSVGWGCRRVRPPPMRVRDMTLCGVPLHCLCFHVHGEVAPDWVLSIGQIELFDI